MRSRSTIRPLPQKLIGILGGCSNVATTEYYRLINSEVTARFGAWDIAETLIVGMNFGNIEAFVRADDWGALERYVRPKVDQLVNAGADLIICVSNTLHRTVEPLVFAHKTPFIHIADPTGAAMKEAGVRRAMLFGTKPVMQMDYLKRRFTDLYHVEIVVPSDEEQKFIDRVIFDELVKGIRCAQSKQTLLAIVDRLVREAHADGLILACTELFMLLEQTDRGGLKIFDTTRLHCRAAVKFAAGDAA